MESGDAADQIESETHRRQLLATLGSLGVVSPLAGCMGGGDGTATDDDNDTTSDDGDGGGTDSPSTDESTPTDGGGSSGQGNVRTPGPNEGRDWDAIADREEASPFDLPDSAPTAFGFMRISSNNELTVSYGSMSGSESMDSGTLYVLFVVDGSVENVLVWESTIQSGDEVLVGPEDSVIPMDVSTVTEIVFAWEHQGQVYVVDKKNEVL